METGSKNAPSGKRERIGLFGGSFDPIHSGHLIMAQEATEGMQLDRTLFIPAAQSPLKGHRSIASPDDRAHMIELAIEDDRRFELSKIDLERQGPSFSIDTALAAQQSFPQARLFWIAGADQAMLLSQWHRMEELAQVVEFIFLHRDRTEIDSLDLPEGLRYHLVGSRVLDLSSSEIRQRLSAGLPVNYFLPSAVLDYIKARRIYS